MDNYYINRTLCSVLEEMRQCHKTRNYGYLPALIEEAQSMANRMESALEDVKDLQKLNQEWHRLRKEVRRLRKEKKELEPEDESDMSASKVDKLSQAGFVVSNDWQGII